MSTVHQPHTHSTDNEKISSSDATYSSLKRPQLAVFSGAYDSSLSWGRRHKHGTWLHTFQCFTVMLSCPCLVIFTWISLSSFDGSLKMALDSILECGAVTFYFRYAPKSSITVAAGYACWIVLQAALYQILPSKLSTGQLTPAGNLLEYRTNGLLAWFITHVLSIIAVVSGLVHPTILAVHWEELLVAVNVFGFLLSLFVYIKAYMSPTHERDCKFSGSMLYDIYMGIELNPRLGNYFDFKLFTNGRPGIIAWTLIDFSFIAYQHHIHGYITYSILVTTALHTLYVVDFFVNEDWYLRTIDICHDHFGFYLAWGSVVWLPAIYTLQVQYLARNPVVLSGIQALAILSTGIGGYIIFRCVNHQKDVVRRTAGKCTLWGSPAKVIRVKYRTQDGFEHESILLYSGWWGLARHVNYLGDLILSYSMCATCGCESLLPWTYAIFMTILLVHRCWRDEDRCSKKYGKGWEEYCRKVKWVIIPYVY